VFSIYYRVYSKEEIAYSKETKSAKPKLKTKNEERGFEL
jgi:hypothetical protein